jgi:hypothetical protein
MSATIKVKNKEFDPQHSSGPAGESVQFKNKRSVSVTIALLDDKWSQSSITLAAEGQPGDGATVQIKSTATGKAQFEAPEKPETNRQPRDKGIMTGDIDIDPSR